jgi:predicted HAD superfamily Cof-like phosphohydrolase
MSDWFNDIQQMHTKFKVYDAVDKFDAETLRKFFELRKSMITEEYNELMEAKSAEDFVDALIDLSVFIIGTLDLFKVNADLAWKEVFDANMSKSVGVKANRPNPLGLPDLIKPEGWQGPDHSNNHGLFDAIFEDVKTDV